MEIKNYFAQDAQGNIMPSANCYLYLPGTTTLATGLVDGNGTPISNPFLASGMGQITFGAPNGVYDLRVTLGARDWTIKVQCADIAQAMDVMDSILGSHAENPTTRNNGQPLQPGDETWNSTDKQPYWWNGASWVALNSSAQQLESKLASPSDGSKIVMRSGLYGVETTESALLRADLTGQNAGIAKYLGQDPGVSRLFLAGYDSLTAGAGGTSWNKYFRKIMRGQLGYGGPGLQLFSGDISSTEGASFGTNMSSIVENGQFYTYSIGGYGLYSLAADGSAFLNWKPKAAWATARFFYLKQPGGGTFLVGTNDSVDADKILVDTANAEFALGYIDVPIGKGTAGQTLGTRKGTGLICMFGALFVYSEKGFLFGNIAKGGRKLADVAAQDSVIRKQWLTLLKPSHFILNGGANDKDTRTGPQHNADLTAIITDIRAASPDTSITIVQHNHIQGEGATYLPEHAVQKVVVAKAFGTNFIDIRKVLGTYADAVSQVLMLDGVHPNDKANRPIAANHAEGLGFSGNSSDPGETPYGGGAGPEVIQRSGSLSTKYALILSGVKTTIYTLGLVAGYPSVSFRFTVTCNRKGTILNKTKLIILTVGNSITTNAANGVTTPTIVQTVTDVSGGLTAGDFTFEAEISAGKCVISVTPLSYESAVVVECDFSAPYNTVTGQAVFEN